jgi:hypothetical protein
MRARAAVVVIASLGLAALGCSGKKAANQPCCRATITGKVKAAGGSPLDSALVGFNFAPETSQPYAFSASTDAGGTYRVDLDWPSSYESPPGRVNLMRLVSRSGYQTDTSFVQISMPTNAEGDVVLTPSPAAP